MKKSPFGLKNILIITFILLAGMPIFIIGFVAIKFVASDIENEARGKNVVIARSLASEVQAFLDGALSTLKTVKIQVEEKEYIDKNSINEFLDDLLIVNIEFDSILIVDSKGIVKFLAPYNQNIIGINLSGLPFIMNAAKYGQPYWSSTFISPQTGKPTIAIAVPAGNKNMVVGYLSLAALNVITDMIQAGGQTYAMILDSENTVIAHPDRNKVLERQNMGHLLIGRQDAHKGEGSLTFTENASENLASISLVPHIEWKIIIATPAREALAPVERIRRMIVFGASLAALLAAVIAFLSLRKATNPLSRLVKYARRIADADYSFENIPASYREIDELVGDFYKMAAIIQSREEALRNSMENLQAFFDAVHESMVIIDREGTVLLSNAVGAERLGKKTQEFVGTCLYDHFSADVLKFRKTQYEKVVDTGKPVYFHDSRAGRYFEQYCYPVYGNEKHLTGVAIFAHDITERKQAEDRIRSSLKEKEIMLKEIHHRVKNNLAIIASILALQSRYVKDEVSLEIFRECENRVRTMAMIHTKLYQSKDLAHINFASYIQELANDLFTSYRIDPDDVEVKVDIEDISLDINTAIPVGLIINELLSNALKYAFPSEGGRQLANNTELREKTNVEEMVKKKNIAVSIKEDPPSSSTLSAPRLSSGALAEGSQLIVISVSDNGIGFPEQLDFRNTKTLGLQLVMALVEQLDANIELKRDSGATIIISFKGTR